MSLASSEHRDTEGGRDRKRDSSQSAALTSLQQSSTTHARQNCRLSTVFCLLSLDANLEQRRPQLAGDEEAVPDWIVSDAVQDGIGELRRHGGEPGEIDPADYAPGGRFDHGNAIGKPDVGVDQAVHELELVQVIDVAVAILHLHATDLRQRLRIEEAKRRRAVAQDESGTVVRKPPPFATVRKTSTYLERLAVVHEPDPRFPRQLEELVAELGQPFGEVASRNVLPLDHRSRIEAHLPERGSAVQTGALEQKSVAVNEALRKGLPVVRVAIDDVVGVDRYRVRPLVCLVSLHTRDRGRHDAHSDCRRTYPHRPGV